MLGVKPDKSAQLNRNLINDLVTYRKRFNALLKQLDEKSSDAKFKKDTKLIMLEFSKIVDKILNYKIYEYKALARYGKKIKKYFPHLFKKKKK
jgi:hypothetical protein